MTRDELVNRYFDWMYQLVIDRYSKLSYRKLFVTLHSTEFIFEIPMDDNRAEDGIELRYRFGREQRYPDTMIASMLDNTPCSILEMMIALSIRCEEQIMDNPDIGNRTGQWFWNMIVNLGLDSMDDEKFDQEKVDFILKRLIERRYERNGKGGLFTVSNSLRDMRAVDIWYQMCWYLDEIV